MTQAIVAILNLYELSLILLAILGVSYDFCRSAFRPRAPVSSV